MNTGAMIMNAGTMIVSVGPVAAIGAQGVYFDDDDLDGGIV